tara:strand:- start:16 stop:990 length:975 start_codon:yes stop_codon:yes gene_type:complete
MMSNNDKPNFNLNSPLELIEKRIKEKKQNLTEMAHYVTQQNGTEPPFQNDYWDHGEAGIYVDVVSGEPLFASVDKFDSGTGWPSFSQALELDHIIEVQDESLGYLRTEVRSRIADSHLGHVFPDGPTSSGLRYCINSAALTFIPVSELKKLGYGPYLRLFYDIAVLAGGCFWGIQELVQSLPGIITTRVGYTGGKMSAPTYDDIKTGQTGHAEALEVVFDSAQISYDDLLIFFFKIHDPTTLNQQGNDRGTQYRSAIFYQNLQQKEVAEAVIKRVIQSGYYGSHLVTEVTESKPFYEAEPEHQNYLERFPNGYNCHYLRQDTSF